MPATQRIDRYELLEEIGRGGFGIVYRARDPVLKRQVAVKTCTVARDVVRERFFREARIAGSLRHASVVTILDCGVEGDTPFLVQEYLDGVDLDQLLARNPGEIAVGTQLSILHGVARGLAHAHARGVVHRDVKPANIRILEDGRIKVMDFGIAKLRDDEARITRTGATLGTVAYLSPEQLRGDIVDHRADIFAFGVVAYELIAGRRPFEGGSVSSLLYTILHTEPPPLPVGCAAELSALVGRCLEKDRERRLADLRQALPSLRLAAEELGLELVVDEPAVDDEGPPRTAPPAPAQGHPEPAPHRLEEAATERLEPITQALDLALDEANLLLLAGDPDGAKSRLAALGHRIEGDPRALDLASRVEHALRVDRTRRVQAPTPPAPAAREPGPAPVAAETGRPRRSQLRLLVLAGGLSLLLSAVALAIWWRLVGDEATSPPEARAPAARSVELPAEDGQAAGTARTPAAGTRERAPLDLPTKAPRESPVPSSAPAVGTAGAASPSPRGTDVLDGAQPAVTAPTAPPAAPSSTEASREAGTPTSAPPPRRAAASPSSETVAPSPGAQTAAPTKPATAGTQSESAAPPPSEEELLRELQRERSAAGIRRALRAYQDAWRSLDHRAVRTVHPTSDLERSDLRPWRTAETRFEGCVLEIGGDRGEARCAITRSRSHPRRQDLVETFSAVRLERQGERWVVVAFEP